MTTPSGASSLSLNFSKSQPLEFEVSVQGIDGSEPEVRFVLILSRNAYDVSIPCTKTDDDTWTANIPKLTVKPDDSVSFRIEVIVDGYFFIPAEGDVIVLRDPAVKLPTTKPAQKPVVKTVFKTVESAPVIPVAEETAPVDSNDGDEDEEVAAEEDEQVEYDPDALANLAEDIPTPYNPRQVAADVIRQTIGNIPATSRVGALFDRDATGRVVTPGVEHHSVAAERKERSDRVRQILNQVD